MSWVQILLSAVCSTLGSFSELLVGVATLSSVIGQVLVIAYDLQNARFLKFSGKCDAGLSQYYF